MSPYFYTVLGGVIVAIVSILFSLNEQHKNRMDMIEWTKQCDLASWAKNYRFWENNHASWAKEMDDPSMLDSSIKMGRLAAIMESGRYPTKEEYKENELD